MGNLEALYQKTARLLADAKGHEQQEASARQIIFYLPDVAGEPIPPDAPPLEANGMRGYIVYLPTKPTL